MPLYMIYKQCMYLIISLLIAFCFIFRYIKLKFDQVNGYLLKLSEDNKCGIKWALQNPVSLLHQHKFPSNEWMTWILM